MSRPRTDGRSAGADDPLARQWRRADRGGRFVSRAVPVPGRRLLALALACLLLVSAGGAATAVGSTAPPTFPAAADSVGPSPVPATATAERNVSTAENDTAAGNVTAEGNVSTAAGQAGTNLLANPSCTMVTTSDDDDSPLVTDPSDPTGWTEGADGSGTVDWTCRVVTGVLDYPTAAVDGDGGYFSAVDSSVAPGETVTLSQRVTGESVVPGHSYALDGSRWLPKGDSIEIELRFLDGGGSELAAQTTGPVPGPDRRWAQSPLPLSGTAPDSTASVEVRLRIVDLNSDGVTDAAVDDLSLTASNTAPTLSTNAAAVVQNESVTIDASTLAATDAEDGPASLTYTVTDDATGGQLYDTGAGQPIEAGDAFTQADVDAGRIEYRHGGGRETTDNVTVSVADPFGATATATLPIAVDVSPSAQDDYVFGPPEDTTLTITDTANGLLADDTDPNGDDLTLAETGTFDTGNGTITLFENGTYTYTPDPNYVGSDSFTYAVTDGESVDEATVFFEVTPVNDPPTVPNATYAVGEGATLSIGADAGLLANATDVDGDALSVVTDPVRVPSNGTVDLSANGSFTYAPDPEFTGTDSFTYAVTDGETNATATVTIDVRARPTFAVQVGSVTSPVRPGEPVLVNALVVNVGSLAGTQTVTLAVNGTEGVASPVDATTLALDPAETAPVSLSYVPGPDDEPGVTLTVATGNDSAETTAVVDGTPPTLTAASRVDDTTVAVEIDDSLSGLDAGSVDASDLAVEVNATDGNATGSDGNATGSNATGDNTSDTNVTVTGVNASGLVDGATGPQTIVVSLSGPVDADAVTVGLAADGDGIADLAGNVRTNGSATATGMDGVAPTVTGLDATVPDAGGGGAPDEVVVAVDASEPLASLDARVVDADGATVATLDRAAFDRVDGRYLARATVPGDGRYAVRLLGVADAAGNEAGLTGIGSPAVRVGLAPGTVADAPPTDLDGDGYYGDVDGDGTRTYADVVALFDAFAAGLESDASHGFDFNRNGRLDFDDVVTLFGRT